MKATRSGSILASRAAPGDGWLDPSPVPGLVSVIIPTYNRAHLITNALASVRGQTYRPIEVLVIDDGSEDDTESVVRAWIAAHAREGLSAHYIRQSNQGAPAARNHGLRRSRGEFIQFLDSDDALLPHKISYHVDALSSSFDAGYVWSDADVVTLGDRPSPAMGIDDGGGRGVPERGAFVRVVGRRDIRPYVVCGLLRRSACASLGPWDEHLRGDQDWEYGLRIIASDIPALYLPGVQYVVVIGHGARIADGRDADSRSALEACRAAEARLERTPGDGGAARHCIALKYTQAALSAMRRGDRAQCSEAMRGARRNCGVSPRLAVKVWGLRILHAAFGGPLTHRLYAGLSSRAKA